MQCDLIMTVLGADRSGLVQQLAQTVGDHGGNWLESRMARLAGQFAGVARIQCPGDKVEALAAKLGQMGLNIQIAREEARESSALPKVSIEVTGNDRPGIVRELTAAIAEAGGNVEELTTGLESAAMSGHPLFRAHGVVSLPEDGRRAALRQAIETLSEDLTVDFRG